MKLINHKRSQLSENILSNLKFYANIIIQSKQVRNKRYFLDTKMHNLKHRHHCSRFYKVYFLFFIRGAKSQQIIPHTLCLGQYRVKGFAPCYYRAQIIFRILNIRKRIISLAESFWVFESALFAAILSQKLDHWPHSSDG